MPVSVEPPSPLAPPPALVQWLGYRRMMLLDSGSAALSLVLEAFRAMDGGPAAGPVQLPGLGCWTLTSAVESIGARPQYYDVDRRLAPINLSDQHPSVLIQPWGGTVDARHYAPAAAPRVLDSTLSIFGGPAGAIAAESFPAAVISLGQAKPLGLPGGGGLLLFDDADLHDELSAILLHYYEDLSWKRRSSRYTGSDRQAAALGIQVDWLRENHAGRVAEVAGVRELVASQTVLEPLAVPGAADEEGVTVVVPFLLPADYPLSGREVHRIAMAERIPLITHPLTPPYLEPAGNDLAGDCPVAEDTARRLVLLPSTLAELGSRDALARFLDSAAAQPAMFRYPYEVPAGGQDPVPANFRGPGILGRRLDGAFVYANQFTRRKYQVSPSVAAELMTRAG